MNLDLLKKLVCLANHNNSEGEANSAARRVCRMIEEANFEFGGETKNGHSNQVNYPQGSVRRYYDEYYEYQKAYYEQQQRQGKYKRYFHWSLLLDGFVCNRCNILARDFGVYIACPKCKQRETK